MQRRTRLTLLVATLVPRPHAASIQYVSPKSFFSFVPRGATLGVQQPLAFPGRKFTRTYASKTSDGKEQTDAGSSGAKEGNEPPSGMKSNAWKPPANAPPGGGGERPPQHSDALLLRLQEITQAAAGSKSSSSSGRSIDKLLELVCEERVKRKSGEDEEGQMLDDLSNDPEFDFKHDVFIKDEDSFDKPTALANRPKRLALHDLKYYSLYPSIVKGWIVDCKTPRGCYEKDGEWYVTTPLEEEEIIDETETRTQRLLREREEAVTVLPADLEGRFRFGVTEKDIQDLGLPPEKEMNLKRILSFKHAGRGEINQFRVAECIAKWKRKPTDTASSEIQVAVLTEKIRYMSDHLRKHHKDQPTKRSLTIFMERRRKLLMYLKKHKTPTYYTLLKDLNLLDNATI